jgi:hypothetical protein
MNTTKYNIEQVNQLLKEDISEEERDALESRLWYLELSEDLPTEAFRPDGSFYLSDKMWVLPTGDTYRD